ncbi:DUF1129 domain-containing protein [Vagococcus jeotgali]|uniref:DUF1129 domain-containing protein n=1 Tax=Vagococcus jeotgali TaxID=3109030 RepID=UPI002DDC5BA3|nr:DUF1129 family protein [Vagococcus sp. B2T-5]
MEELTVVDLQQKVAENRELEKKLTKKNDQFIFDLKKIISENYNITESKKAEVFNEILTTLVDGQKSGTTAKQLYGTPTEAAEAVINKPKAVSKQTFWKIWLDNSLLLLGLLSLMTGIVSMFARNSQGAQTQGIVSLLIGAIAGGFSFYLIYRYIYIYDTPGYDQTNRPGMLKTGAIMALCFIPWILIFSLSAFIKPEYNPSLPPMWVITIGVLALGARYLVKKQLGIKGNLFMR